MNEKQCPKCREIFPATTEFFYRNGKLKSGSVRLYSACKNCEKARDSKKERSEANSKFASDWYYRNKERVLSRQKEYKKQNKEMIHAREKARYKAKRQAEGKEVGVLAPKKNFYIGYVVLESGTYFKAGITSYDSMEKRYKRKDYGKVIGVQQTDFWRFDTEDEARAMEREFLSHCKIFLGEPVMGKEWFSVEGT